jgi:UDP-N-acetylmuramoyl-tripeptide--D-alanyl-D-alanine ligase
VAVAGSVGKTSTKLAIARVLQEKYGAKVMVHQGNYNDPVSIPISIFGLEVPDRLTDPRVWVKVMRRMDRMIRSKYPYKVVVVELGTDHPGDIPAFMRYLTPDIGVLTAITPEHMEFFKTINRVAEEEFALARGSRVVVACGDDPEIASRLDRLKQKVITYGDSGTVRFASKGIRLGKKLIADSNQDVISDHGRKALLAAAAVGDELGMKPREIEAGLAGVKPVAGRMKLLRGLSGSRIIDDTYNASPAAAIAALDTLYKHRGRRIAILGMMNELGAYSERAHREVGAHACKLDLLITIGRDAASFLAPAAIEAGLDKSKVRSFQSPFEAGRYLAPKLKSGDWVLAKGSQNGVFAEEAVKQLLADPKESLNLVRQSDAWLAKKYKQFGVK